MNSPWPQCCDIFDALPRAAAAYSEHNGGWISKTFRGNAVLLQAIDKYEKDLKAESFLTQFVLPPTQEILVYAGSGNEKGYVGRQRWLFYRPGIDYCTGPGFLNPRHMARRADSGTQWRPAPQPDPRAAILQFHRQLAERNIRLVLMPTPDKATIHPEKFSSRYEGRRMSVHNPSYRQFLDELEAEGVLVCDVTDALAQYRDRSGNAVYLATDTHWRPEAMELAAAELARLIEEKIVLGATAVDRDRRQTSKDVKNLGDIAMMLKLRQNQGVFGEEVVTIRPVTDAAGEPWRPDPAAEVLVLGDSFANIYSLEMMNWGCCGRIGRATELRAESPRGYDPAERRRGVCHARDAQPRVGPRRRPPGRQEGRRLAVRRARTGRRRLETARHDAQAVAQTGRRPATGGPRVDRQRDDRREIGGPAGRPNALCPPHLHTRPDRLAGPQRDAHRAEDRRVSFQHEKPSEYAGLLLAGRQTGETEASAVETRLLPPIRTDQSHGD